MSLTAQEMMQVMEKAKELGLTNFKTEGLEFSCQPAIQTQPNIPAQPNVPAQAEREPQAALRAEDLVSPISPFDDLTDEQILYWSSPYYDELEAKQELMRQARLEDSNNG